MRNKDVMQLSKSRKKTGLLALASLAIVSLASGTMTSLALFTDTRTDDSTFTTGTIVLDATKIAAMDLTSSAMMPGDTVSTPVEVENDGTAQLRYAVSQSSTDGDGKALRDELRLTVRTEDQGAGAYGNDGDYCDDTNGSALHATAPLGASGDLVGDPTQGPQSGDRILAGGAHDVLCFFATLTNSAPDSVQGATTTTTFSFAAEQTANNP